MNLVLQPRSSLMLVSTWMILVMTLEPVTAVATCWQSPCTSRLERLGDWPTRLNVPQLIIGRVPWAWDLGN